MRAGRRPARLRAAFLRETESEVVELAAAGRGRVGLSSFAGSARACCFGLLASSFGTG